MIAAPVTSARRLTSFVGRQPIFDRNLRVHGYEILYRKSADAGASSVVDGDQASSAVILSTVVDMGLARVVGSRPAFINVTRRLLVSHDLPSLLPRGQVVIEVLEDIEPDAEVLDALRRLARAGYRIALDDFVYTERTARLLRYANYVKIDVHALTPAELERQVAVLGRYDVQLIAEKIETREELDLCRRLGFRYFQGYLLSRTRIVSGRRLPTTTSTVLHLLTQLYDTNADIDRITEIIRQDISLGYRVLRLVNSVLYATVCRVDSIGGAVMMLGLRNLRQWVSVFVLASSQDAPHACIASALLRARFCEALGNRYGLDGDVLFTVGLFSILEGLLGEPMENILGDLPVSDEIRRALLDGGGLEGEILNMVVAYEQGRWDDVAASRFAGSPLSAMWLEAVEWTREGLRCIGLESDEPEAAASRGT